MKSSSAIQAGACVLALLLCPLATAADGPYPIRTVTKSNPAANGHAKASSFAPQAHSKNHVYGAPIQPPILKTRKPAHKAPGAVTSHAVTPSAATPSPTTASPDAAHEPASR